MTQTTEFGHYSCCFPPRAYLSNASDWDWDTVTGVDLVTLHIQGEGVEGDSVYKWIQIKQRTFDRDETSDDSKENAVSRFNRKHPPKNKAEHLFIFPPDQTNT